MPLHARGRSGTAHPRSPRSRRRARWRSTMACGPGVAHRLMVRRIHRISVAAHDAVQQRAGDDRTAWPGSSRGLGCSCARASAIASGMCWISVPPSATASNCWPPQMPSTGMSRASAPCTKASSVAVRSSFSVTVRVAAVLAVHRRIDVEGAAGHHQGVDAGRDSRCHASEWCGSAMGRPPAATIASA